MTNGQEFESRPAVDWRRIARVVVAVGIALAGLAALIAILSGPGYRMGWWGLRTAFTALRWAAYFGIAGAALSLLGVGALFATRERRRLVWPALGVLVGLTVAYVPWSWRQQARHVPPIHDITTDVDHPPEFVAVLPLRQDAPNPPEYGGPEIAAQQRQAYPDLGPVVLDAPPAQVFERALAAARSMGWEIVAATEPDGGEGGREGTIEATATTFWYGFKDDVVVRITPVEGGSRIDVRSVSRVGRSDVGTNAKRIREYVARLTEEGAS